MLTYGLHPCSAKANKFSPFPSLSTFFRFREVVGKERRSHRSSSRNYFRFFKISRERKEKVRGGISKKGKLASMGKRPQKSSSPLFFGGRGR